MGAEDGEEEEDGDGEGDAEDGDEEGDAEDGDEEGDAGRGCHASDGANDEGSEGNEGMGAEDGEEEDGEEEDGEEEGDAGRGCHASDRANDEASEGNEGDRAQPRARAEGGEPGDGGAFVLVDDIAECARALAPMIDGDGGAGRPGRARAAAREVAIDFEGENLCRDGELCLVQLAERDGPVILLDIVVMGQRAFEEGRLRELLECNHILKIGFDGRADADALFHLHGCQLNNYYDLQVAFGVWKDNR